MTSTELQENDLRQILATAGEGNYVAAYDNIVKAVETTTRTAQIVNRKTRVERFKAAVAAKDRTGLARANKVFGGIVKKIRVNAELSENMEEPRMLAPEEAANLMDEIVDVKEGKDYFTAREEEIKRLVFNHLTEMFAADGEEFPEHINGSIDIPSMGKRFSREGAGRKEPELQEKVLKSLVDDDVWAAITDREVKIVETVNIGKLMAHAANDPDILEDLRRSLKVGEWKTARLNVREI